MDVRTLKRSCALAAALSVVVATRVQSTENAGKAVSLTIGYLSALYDHNTIWVQGIAPTFSSDNIFIGAVAEGPMFWKSLYPLAAAKWLLDNRYTTDEFAGHIDTRGFLACAGLGYGMDAWQATLRLETAVGFWWENVKVDYTGFFGLEAFEIDNDQTACLLSASLSFPFTKRIDSLISCELLLRPTKEVNGEFENGRWYRIETHGTYGTVSVGLVWGLNPP